MSTRNAVSPTIRAAIEGILAGPADRWPEAADALCAQHPDHEAAIRGFLDVLLVESARVEGLDPGVDLGPGDADGPFRILREIGRQTEHAARAPYPLGELIRPG